MNKLKHYLSIYLLLTSMLSAFFVSAKALDQTQDQPSVFDEAQQAAAEGHFDDVVGLLTAALSSGNLDDDNQAIAYSNRGIAYSLQKKYALAVQDLQKAYNLNPEHLLTLNHLGILSEHIEKNFERAAIWYERSASLGYAASQVNLGNLYRQGRGVEKDTRAAIRLFQQAVDQGYPAAMVALGEMTMDGLGVARNYAEGLSLLRTGVAQGVVTGNYYIGLSYERGHGATQNFDKALEHYMLAAVQGHAPSQGSVGYLYRWGNGVDKNFVEAVKWYRLAAEQGDVKAANRLAWLLATCPVGEVCNGQVALEFANLAVSAEPSAGNLDSLAAAYARVGEFDQAMAVIRRIGEDPTLNISVRAKYARRLDRYQHGIPFQL